MARPLRIEYPNAWYHVMNRGLRREDIFFTRSDRISFLSLLKDISAKFHIQVHAYCLMDNHYHLLLNTPLPNLNRAMRHLGGVYTQRLNRHHERDGPLFRGRYKSILVESESYLTKLSRYIHLNPVVANMVQAPEEYEWSSFRAYMQLAIKPKWLHCNETLSSLGLNHNQEPHDAYRNFIVEGIDNDTLQLMNAAKTLPIVGSDAFKKQAAQQLDSVTSQEIPDQKPLMQHLLPSLTTIQKTVQGYFNINEAVMSSPGFKVGNLARRCSIYLACKHTNHSHQKIANYFCNTSRYGIRQSFQRFIDEMNTDPTVVKIIIDLERNLQSKTTLDQ